MGLMRKYFGKQSGRVKLYDNKYNNSDYKKARRVNISKEGIEHSYVWVGTPGITPSSEIFRDNIAPSILVSSILGGGMDSRLFTEVREKKGLVYGIGSNLDYWNQGSVHLVNCSTSSKNVDEVVSSIFAEVEKIKNDFVSEEELQRAKNKFKTAHYSTLESSYSLASLEIDRILLNPMSIDEFTERLNSVTPDDIKRSANIILDEAKSLTMVCERDNED
jgi:predicted Zn-dependent peptidase